MGLKKVSKLIEKINILHDSLLSIDEEISSIEKDLLLNYIRQLYEQVLDIGTEDQPLKAIPVVKEVIDLPKEIKKEEPNEVSESQVTEPTNGKTEIIQSAAIVSEPAEQVVLVQTEKENVVEESAPEQSHDPIIMEEINEELVAMFEIKEAKELSEKLSNMPIKDLGSALGINDRFLTVNELFGGDSSAFKSCIDHINGLESYEEAKSYLLSNVAQKYEWSSSDRLKKAAGFISLVQRRFR